MLLYIAITQSAFSLGEMIDICPCLYYILTPPSAGGLYRVLHGRGGAGGDQVHVLRGLQHLLHPVRQGWVLSRVAGARGEYCSAEGRVEGRGCSAVDRVCVGEELGQGGGQQSRHLDTAQGECRGGYIVWRQGWILSRPGFLTSHGCLGQERVGHRGPLRGRDCENRVVDGQFQRICYCRWA